MNQSNVTAYSQLQNGSGLCKVFALSIRLLVIGALTLPPCPLRFLAMQSEAQVPDLRVLWEELRFDLAGRSQWL